jgi:transcriptional regulator with XRE-family HTH domain
MLAKIDRILRDRRWSQADLQRAAGLAETRMSKWRAGQGEPSASQALRIARAINVPLEWLVNDEAPDEPPAAAEPAGVALSDLDRAVLDVARRVGHSRLLALAIEAQPPVDYSSFSGPVGVVTPLPDVPSHTARPPGRPAIRKDRSG